MKKLGLWAIIDILWDELLEKYGEIVRFPDEVYPVVLPKRLLSGDDAIIEVPWINKFTSSPYILIKILKLKYVEIVLIEVAVMFCILFVIFNTAEFPGGIAKDLTPIIEIIILNDPDERILTLIKVAIPEVVVVKRLVKFVLFPEHFDPEMQTSESPKITLLASVIIVPLLKAILEFTVNVLLLVLGYVNLTVELKFTLIFPVAKITKAWFKTTFVSSELVLAEK